MTPNEFETVLSNAEVQLTRLKHLYEQWFQGLERLEPTIPRKQFDRAMHQMRKTQPRNTALRFRFNSLIQRYTTMQTYWRRVARQIEEGTYRRDLMRARRRREKRREELTQVARGEEAPSNVHELTEDSDVNVDELIAEASGRLDALFADDPPTTKRSPTEEQPRPSPPKPPPAPMPIRAKPKRSKPKSSPGIPLGGKTPPPLKTRVRGPGDARMKQIYDTYVDAKKRNNERVDHVDYEKVAKSIKRMVPKLDRKYKGKRVDFEVVVKDGRVGLKPVVKK